MEGSFVGVSLGALLVFGRSVGHGDWNYCLNIIIFL